MLVCEIANELSFEVLAGSEGLAKQVTGGYTSDLLSNVMGNAKPGNIWITMQAHQNVIAVASLAGLAAVVLAGGVQPDKDTLIKAQEQDVVLLATSMPAFEAAGLIYQLGIKGL